MVNISLLEKSIPVAPIKIAALDSCHELATEGGFSSCSIQTGVRFPQ